MTHKELSEPIFGLREPERPLTRLLKTVFTFTLAQPISPHEPRQNWPLYVSNRRKYFYFSNVWVRVISFIVAAKSVDENMLSLLVT